MSPCPPTRLSPRGCISPDFKHLNRCGAQRRLGMRKVRICICIGKGKSGRGGLSSADNVAKPYRYLPRGSLLSRSSGVFAKARFFSSPHPVNRFAFSICPPSLPFLLLSPVGLPDQTIALSGPDAPPRNRSPIPIPTNPISPSPSSRSPSKRPTRKSNRREKTHGALACTCACCCCCCCSPPSPLFQNRLLYAGQEE